jgi:hypothetical protein
LSTIIMVTIQGWKHFSKRVNHRYLVVVMSSSYFKSDKFINLKPLPCPGTYMPSEIEMVNAFFLGPEQMAVQERDDNKCIARGLIPIPIPGEMEAALASAMKSDQRSSVFKSWSGQLITDRNGGFFDGMQSAMQLSSNLNARKEMYESLRMKASCESPYHGIMIALEKTAGLEIRGLLLEVADKQAKFSYVLGAAVLVTRIGSKRRWMLSAEQFDAIDEVHESKDAALVKCKMDELVGLAFATNLPIVISGALYDVLSMDGLLETVEVCSPDTGLASANKMILVAPYFSSSKESRLWRKEQERNTEKSKRKASKVVPRAEEIRDASSFLRLRTSEKRAILRATGVQDLPRPREGRRAVDALLIPLLDEELAYEVLRRLGETKGDFEQAARMSDYESRKPALARQINEARKAGDRVRAKELCDELNSLSTLRFDPTNPDGASAEWDVSAIHSRPILRCGTDDVCCL